MGGGNLPTKKAAFTLAEILITLGIIGVVAAMTIPTLIANYKEKALDNQFKKSYSLFSQVLLSVKGEFGYTPQCYNYSASGYSGYKLSECGEFRERFLDNLKISRLCENKAFENGCIPKYNGLDNVLKNEHKDDEDYDEEYWEDYTNNNCPGFAQSQILNRSKVYILADGTILFFYFDDAASFRPGFAVDINGKSGPNKWGHDLFAFLVTIDSNTNNLKLSAFGCMRAEDGGLYTSEMIDKVFHKK